MMTGPLQTAADLDGGLTILLLPLRSEELLVPDLIETVTNYGATEDPFLSARAQRKVSPGSQWSRARRDPWQWSEPVLVASVREDVPNSRVIFGRSAATLDENDPSDQAIDGPCATSASLWVVPGGAWVLALERLETLPEKPKNWAKQVDELGGLLAAGVGGSGMPGPPCAQKLVNFFLVGFKKDSTCSLEELFGCEFQEFGSGARGSLLELFLPRRATLMNDKIIEGMVVGVAGSVDDLGVEPIVARSESSRLDDDDDDDFDNVDEHQSHGYRWIYREIEIAIKPAGPAAVSAVRSDGRVVLLDQDSMSIYHDYCGFVGCEIVLSMIPVMGFLGQQHRDFWWVFGQLTEIESAADLGLGVGSRGEDLEALWRDLEKRTLSARAVRSRLEASLLFQDQVLNEENFKVWTGPTSLRREIAPWMMVDGVESALERGPASGNESSLLSLVRALAETLALRQGEVRARSERLLEDRRNQEDVNRARQVDQQNRRVSLVAASIGLLGLASLYSAVLSLLDLETSRLDAGILAGLWTVAIVASAVLVVGGSLVVVQRSRKHDARLDSAGFRLPLILSIVALAVAVVGLSVGVAAVRVAGLSASGAALVALLITQVSSVLRGREALSEEER